MTPRRAADAAATSVASPSGRGLRIAFFGHDSNESTVRKRVAAFTAAGANVLGLMFHRTRKSVSSPAPWRNIDLGETADANYRRRLAAIAVGFWKVRAARRDLENCDVIYARNIDMLALATLSKYALGLSTPIIYEALDIHAVFTKGGPKSRMMRAVERALLKAASLLVVSSPTFISRYFEPIQGYRGPWYLLENKVFLGSSAGLPRISEERAGRAHPPWVLGWFGILRCTRSLDLLRHIAETLGDKVVIHIRGTASEPDGITDQYLRAMCSTTKNMFFFGAYDSARDLEAIYGAVDIGWAVDYSAQGANSDWLIPNRVYESGLYGVPVIARKRTTTGDMVEKLDMGWSFEEPFGESVAKFLSGLDTARFADALERLKASAPGAFVDTTDTPELLDRMKEIANPSARKQRSQAVAGCAEPQGHAGKT